MTQEEQNAFAITLVGSVKQKTSRGSFQFSKQNEDDYGSDFWTRLLLEMQPLHLVLDYDLHTLY